MARNQYIDGYHANNEQELIENLVVEAIKFYGHDVLYIPREGINQNTIFNENEFSKFEGNYPIEVYVKNVDSFGGDGIFLQKFGLEIRHQMIFQMSIRSFEEFVKPETEFEKPREGDLIFVPMLNACYEIKFVENAAIFYQLGKLQSYDLTCELFEYSNEDFNTGNTHVDETYNDFSFLDDVNIDPFSQNDDIQEEADEIIDWSEDNPFGVDK